MPETIIEIQKIGAKGQGVGHDSEENIYFVERAIPGDRVRVEYEAKARRYRDASLLELMSPSGDRIEPTCSHFLVCGGCDWLNWKYEAQLEAKEAMMTHALTRLGVMVGRRLPIKAASKTMGYRRRVQLRYESKQIGFFRRQSHELVDIMDCPIAVPEINQFIRDAKASLPDDKGKVEVGILDDGSVRIDWNKEHAFGGFTQVNQEQNNYLRTRVKEYCRAGDNVLELFCGDGNLTSAFMDVVVETIAVDGSQSAVDRAGARGGAGMVSFFRDNIDAGLLKRLPHEFNVSLLIVDPPRQGLGMDIAALIPKGVKRILYVSCAPQELARDAIRLMASGFELSELQCIDMFPQTRHIESLAVFERSLVN